MTDDETTRPEQGPEDGAPRPATAREDEQRAARDGEQTPVGPEGETPPTGAPGTGAGPAAGASSPVLDQVTAATEDLARRAAPAVRQVGARAAVVAAELAEASGPWLRRAAAASADASARLAARARAFAAELERDAAGPSDAAEASATATGPSDAAEASATATGPSDAAGLATAGDDAGPAAEAGPPDAAPGEPEDPRVYSDHEPASDSDPR